MGIVTYRSVDQIDGGTFYCCIHAYDGGRHIPEPGPADPDAPMILCEECSDKLDRNPDLEILRRDTEPPDEPEPEPFKEGPMFDNVK
jgi:hypothetical protein